MNFQLLIMQNGYIYTHFITSDIDLLEVYKQSLLTNNGYIVWEKGVIDCKNIVGIIKD